MGLFGMGDQNNKNRRAEIDAYNRDNDLWKIRDEAGREQHDLDRESYYAKIKYQEDNIRFQEREVINNYNQEVARQQFEFDTANKVYNQSLKQAYNQKAYNELAEKAAYQEQDLKMKDELLGVMFEESDTFLEYAYATTGLKVDKHNKLVAADFQDSKNETKFIGDLGKYEIERRKARSDSQIEAQKAIIEGMKAAGTIRASGTAGRSSAKAVLGVMAESGALRAAIANGLMYAEQDIDLGIAQLKDMLILDQTMVLAARDAAANDYDLKGSKLDASNAVDKIKISATKQSIKQRDKIVRQKIANARRQADLNAEASILLEPERVPEITNPTEFYANYDNPDTKDWLELFVREQHQQYPEYQEEPRPDYERDYHYSMGRGNVAASNFGDVLKIGGTIAATVGSAGAAMAPAAGAGAGELFGMTAAQAATWSAVGTGLTGLSNGFYSRR